MSGQATTELCSSVDLSKQKTKKPARNKESNLSGSNIKMLNKNDMKDHRAIKKNKSQLSKEKSKFCHTSFTNILIVFIFIMTWLVFVATFIMVVILYLKVLTLETANVANVVSVRNQRQNNLSKNSFLVGADDKIRETIEEACPYCTVNLSKFVSDETYQNTSSSIIKVHEKFNATINNIHNNIIDNINYNFSIFKTSLTDYDFSSCSQALSTDSSYLSVNYILRSSTGALRSVYCDMTNTFGGDSKGWMRIAKFDVNHCPSGLMAHTSGSIETCIVSDNNAGCTEIVYSTAKISYAEITGQIRGYQIGTLDGFIDINSQPRSINISANYVDGISVISNNEHIWTFAAGCDCNSMKPDTIGSNYTCDQHPSCSAGAFCNTQLWESQKCGEYSPWFLRTLVHPTTAHIIVRVCRDQNREDEDLAISTLELYVQ